MTTQPQAKYRLDYQQPDFLIANVDLRFELDPDSTRVTNTMTLSRQGHHNKDLVLDGDSLTLRGVWIDGVAMPQSQYSQTDNTLQIRNVPDQFELTIVTEIAPATNEALEGLYFQEQSYCTQCEAEGFRRITYYLDRPDVLAVFTTTVVAAKQGFPYLLSNGNKVDAGEEGERHWVKWHDPHPKPCYLFALVAGDFDLLEDEFVTQDQRTVKLQLFVNKGQVERGRFAMTSLKNAMAWDERRFGLVYDLDIYMVVAVDFFNMGAMENKGLNVFNAKYVLASQKTATDQDFLNVESVIGHEYFHNWTGNRITCRDWFQLSLKEGLTVFRDQEFSSDLGSRAVNRIKDVRIIRSHQFTEDAGPMAHPIRPDKVIEMNNFYTVTVYNKGAEVIRMLHTLLGEEGFQKGMRLYVERHDGQAVTCEDFVKAMEDANKRDFSLFRRWYSQAGTPVVKAKVEYDPQQRQLTLTLAQHTPATPGQTEKQAQHIPVAISAYSQVGQPLAIFDGQHQTLLSLTESEQVWQWQGVNEPAVLALFDNFSAPVKVEREVNDRELMVLMMAADDAVSRWDAAQQLFQRLVQDAIAEQRDVEVTGPVLEACRQLLRADTDPALRALALTLPTAATVAENYQTIPVEAIVRQLQCLQSILAKQLYTDWLTVYETLAEQTASYELAAQDIAARQLKQVALQYIAESGKAGSGELLRRQFNDASNLTDQLGALQAAVSVNHNVTTELLSAFDEQWRGEKLVMDKWFSVQALRNAPTTVENVAELMKHADFSLKNPNRVYSLLAAFTQNMAQFHRADGAGYRLVGQVIRELNQTNPQVASRLLTPFMAWKRYDTERQQRMLHELQLIRELPNLAADLYEKVENSLSA
ncbi:aminopeptidase N [Idiomarina tyrosinivorans]|uniref:Aminopeptidase N n=1 Tax=Idiomarina tyrosinivorans TaxID=1445662 RepID=A0A432ZTT2_9GAMM|nr:aminopeptidase N [Idiomarina tyrosinivorans]RUO81293.1 aminopeptidase N [Idiomarina tyrosinivorans]